MELDRAGRYLEVLLCLLAIVAFHVRMRTVCLDAPADSGEPALRSAMRPIQIGGMVLLVAGIAIWTNARLQPYAHALTIPALMSMGVAGAIARGAVRPAAPR